MPSFLNGRVNLETFLVGFVANLIIVISVCLGLFKLIELYSEYETILTYLMFLIAGIDIFFIISLLLRRHNDLDGVKESWIGPRSRPFLVTGNKKRNKNGSPPNPGVSIKGLFGF